MARTSYQFVCCRIVCAYCLSRAACNVLLRCGARLPSALRRSAAAVSVWPELAQIRSLHARAGLVLVFASGCHSAWCSNVQKVKTQITPHPQAKDFGLAPRRADAPTYGQAVRTKKSMHTQQDTPQVECAAWALALARHDNDVSITREHTASHLCSAGPHQKVQPQRG